MQTQLYPREYGEDSLERHLARHSRRSQVVYVTVVAALATAIALLPVMKVDVSVQSSGIVRPTTEKHEVKARASGVVERVLVRPNQRVREGEALLSLRAGALDEQAGLLAAQIAEKRSFVADLEALVRSPDGTPSFGSGRYRQDHAQYRNDMREARLRVDQAQRELERIRELGARALAARSEVEEKEYQAAQAVSAAQLARERYLSRWQTELAAVRNEMRDLQGRSEALRQDRTLYAVQSPVTGTVEEVEGLSPGSFVTAGEAVAVISPASDIVAEVYVTPRDIGLIRVGSPVRLQVDAFNYNDWGFVTGKVVEISDDYTVLEQQPVFRVRCSLDREHLALKNGFRGRLKKGMTLRARFVVARRSLFQLLYDDVNDWLNPVQSAEPSPAAAR
jgi:HlyD family secretion protein